MMGVPVVSDYQESGNKIIFKGAEGDTFVDIEDATIVEFTVSVLPYI